MVRRFSTLVIDLDGTLLNRCGEVSEASQAAVKRAHDAGFEIIIASGRAWAEARAALTVLRNIDYMIAAGGALLCDARDGATVESRVMHRAVVADSVAAMLEAEHRALLLKDRTTAGYDYVTVGNAPLDPASEWWFEHLPVEVRHLSEIDEDEHPEATVRTAVVAGETELQSLADHLRTRLGERAFLQHWPAVTSSHATGSTTHLLEVFGADVNKWTMIERHCDHAKIDPTTVIAIGDGLNDVEMITHAGLGVAMANADARVAAVADQVIGHHHEDGVAKFIDQLIDTME